MEKRKWRKKEKMQKTKEKKSVQTYCYSARGGHAARGSILRRTLARLGTSHRTIGFAAPTQCSCSLCSWIRRNLDPA